MSRPVLLAVAEGATSYAPLLAGLVAAGERFGWLDLDAAPAPPPAGLEAAAAAGALRAVAVGGGRVMAVKPVRGAVVLDDLLRQHFLGCRLGLVRGGEDLVRLAAGEDGWRLTAPAGRVVRLSTAELVAKLRRPGFWRRLEGKAPALGAVED